LKASPPKNEGTWDDWFSWGSFYYRSAYQWNRTVYTNMTTPYDWTSISGPVVESRQPPGINWFCWMGTSHPWAVTDALRAHYNLKYNKDIEFSKQQIIDCLTFTGQNFDGYKVLPYASAVGLCLENQYPYRGAAGWCSIPSICTQIQVGTGAVTFDYTEDYQNTSPTYYTTSDLYNLIQKGPFFTYVSPLLLPGYSSGIISYVPSTLHPDPLYQETVLVVGYGIDPVYGPYWKCKFNFSTSWGENGYFRYAAKEGNLYNGGFNDAATQPIL